MSASLHMRVLSLWFGPGGELSLSKPLDAKLMKLWFSADPAVDAQIRADFLADWEQLKFNTNSLYHSLTEDPKSALAGVILLDQFSRNMFRDTPQMFATDDLALSLSRRAIGLNLHKRILHPVARNFLYMPFMHSEDLETHHEGLALFRSSLSEEEARSGKESIFLPYLQANIDYEIRHGNIIQRFGRYPHRNSILGRKSTQEETEYLENGGDHFDPRRSK